MSGSSASPVDTGGLVVGTSALVVVVGAFLRWVTIPFGDASTTIDGIDLFEAVSPVFNGLVTVAVATLVTVLALFLPDRESVNVSTAIAGLGIEVIAVSFVVAPDVAVGTALSGGAELPLSNIGAGVYVTLVGGLGILLGGVSSYRR